jgi:hypothetical protein
MALVIELRGGLGLRERLPEVFAALVECVAAVNARHVARAQPPRVALALF